MTASILIIAGESSGEKYGARLVHEFKKIHPSISFFGIGGQNMEKEGVDLLYPVQEMALVGGFEIISHLPRLRKIFRRLHREIAQKKPVASVLIDSPDFNLRVAKKLKSFSVPVLYYVSPTVWAWRKGRLNTIKKTVDKMLLIFPFEEEIYKQHEIPCVYVGHPLIESLKISLSKEEFFRKHQCDPAKTLISILPGSRQNELKFHMPVLTKAVRQIRDEFSARFLLLLAENLSSSAVFDYIPPDIHDLKVIAENKYEAMAYSHMVLAACGTANLEAALLGTPLVSFYRIFPLTFFLGARLVTIKNYSMVNILAGKRIVPELIQNKFTPQNVTAAVKKIMESEEIQSKMIDDFKSIKALLGNRKASQNAAKELADMVSLNDC